MKSQLTYLLGQILTVLCLATQPSPCNATEPTKVPVAQVDAKKPDRIHDPIHVESAVHDPQSHRPTSLPQHKKPLLLAPIESAPKPLPSALDELIVNQYMSLSPHVPLVQSIQLAIDYNQFAWSLWKTYRQRQMHQYVSSLHILLRNNIQIFGKLGHDQLYPTPVTINGEKQQQYSIRGYYGSGGIRYVTKYNLQSNIYVGMSHARSYFRHSAIAHNLKATWWEINFGAEQALFFSWAYAGFMIHLKGLGNFEKLATDNNYVIPGYGRNVNRIVPDISFYIKFQLSFLEKQLSFGVPRQR